MRFVTREGDEMCSLRIYGADCGGVADGNDRGALTEQFRLRCLKIFEYMIRVRCTVCNDEHREYK